MKGEEQARYSSTLPNKLLGDLNVSTLNDFHEEIREELRRFQPNKLRKNQLQ